MGCMGMLYVGAVEKGMIRFASDYESNELNSFR